MSTFELPEDGTIHLDSIGSWPPAAHRVYKDQMLAVKAAWLAQRPLLVKGEPGVGKSQLARAVAQYLGWQFIDINIQPRTEYQDLLWEFDAVARLAQAQLLGTTGNSTKQPRAGGLPQQLERSQFIVPGRLWWAVRPLSARVQGGSASKTPSPERIHNPKHPDKVVLLIDEIDKADANLPNGLLEFLGNGDFSLPVKNKIIRQESRRQMLTIITSNDERDLPPAFVRRCFVLTMSLPKEDSALTSYLQQRGEAWREKMPDCIGSLSSKDIENAAEMVVTARKHTPSGIRKPSPAEFLDLLKVLAGIPEQEERKSVMDSLADVVLKTEGWPQKYGQ